MNEAIEAGRNMQKFYLRKDSCEVLNQKEYDEILSGSSGKRDLVLLGEFVDKSQARRYLYQTYMPRKEKNIGN